MEEPEKPSL